MEPVKTFYAGDTKTADKEAADYLRHTMLKWLINVRQKESIRQPPPADANIFSLLDYHVSNYTLIILNFILLITAVVVISYLIYKRFKIRKAERHRVNLRRRSSLIKRVNFKQDTIDNSSGSSKDFHSNKSKKDELEYSNKFNYMRGETARKESNKPLDNFNDRGEVGFSWNPKNAFSDGSMKKESSTGNDITQKYTTPSNKNSVQVFMSQNNLDEIENFQKTRIETKTTIFDPTLIKNKDAKKNSQQSQQPKNVIQAYNFNQAQVNPTYTENSYPCYEESNYSNSSKQNKEKQNLKKSGIVPDYFPNYVCSYPLKAPAVKQSHCNLKTYNPNNSTNYQDPWNFPDESKRKKLLISQSREKGFLKNKDCKHSTEIFKNKISSSIKSDSKNVEIGANEITRVQSSILMGKQHFHKMNKMNKNNTTQNNSIKTKRKENTSHYYMPDYKVKSASKAKLKSNANQISSESSDQERFSAGDQYNDREVLSKTLDLDLSEICAVTKLDIPNQLPEISTSTESSSLKASENKEIKRVVTAPKLLKAIKIKEIEIDGSNNYIEKMHQMPNESINNKSRIDLPNLLNVVKQSQQRQNATFNQLQNSRRKKQIDSFIKLIFDEESLDKIKKREISYTNIHRSLNLLGCTLSDHNLYQPDNITKQVKFGDEQESVASNFSNLSSNMSNEYRQKRKGDEEFNKKNEFDLFRKSKALFKELNSSFLSTSPTKMRESPQISSSFQNLSHNQELEEQVSKRGFKDGCYSSPLQTSKCFLNRLKSHSEVIDRNLIGKKLDCRSYSSINNKDILKSDSNFPHSHYPILKGNLAKETQEVFKKVSFNSTQSIEPQIVHDSNMSMASNFLLCPQNTPQTVESPSCGTPNMMYKNLRSTINNRIHENYYKKHPINDSPSRVTNKPEDNIEWIGLPDVNESPSFFSEESNSKNSVSINLINFENEFEKNENQPSSSFRNNDKKISNYEILASGHSKCFTNENPAKESSSFESEINRVYNRNKSSRVNTSTLAKPNLENISHSQSEFQRKTNEDYIHKKTESIDEQNYSSPFESLDGEYY